MPINYFGVSGSKSEMIKFGVVIGVVGGFNNPGSQSLQGLWETGSNP